MNCIIHDMQGEILRGDSMRNPKFRSPEGKLKHFDLVVANPMWNQTFPADVYENDAFNRFDKQGGTVTGKADWAWLQHTLSYLKDAGRVAIVLDTGAVSRGSGSKNEDKERSIRKWFVDKDLVDGVILMPDNLFYTAAAAGIIIVLRRKKSKARVGKITLVNASGEFKKGTPKTTCPTTSSRKLPTPMPRARMSRASSKSSPPQTPPRTITTSARDVMWRAPTEPAKCGKFLR